MERERPGEGDGDEDGDGERDGEWDRGIYGEKWGGRGRMRGRGGGWRGRGSKRVRKIESERKRGDKEHYYNFI